MQNNKLLFSRSSATYYFLILFAFSSHFFLTGCDVAKSPTRSPQSSDDKNNPPAPVPPIPTPTPTPTPAPPQRFPACYLSHCFQTTAMSDVVDPKKDYQYPDPAYFPRPVLRGQYIAPTAILDLINLDPAIKLADHFKLGDFMSKGKGRYALYSSDVLTTLETLRHEINRAIIITSGFRSPGYNRDVDGAATWSRHTYGDAVDFYINGLTIAELKPLCEKHHSSFTLIYQKHIHCDWRKAPLDTAFYLPTRRKGFDEPDFTPAAKMISEQSRIVAFETAHSRIFHVEMPLEEDDEGTPIYAWSAVLPSGETISATTPTIELPKAPGIYNIKVVIGGSVVVEESQQW